MSPEILVTAVRCAVTTNAEVVVQVWGAAGGGQSLSWVVVLGALAGGGLVLIVSGLRPAPPRLTAVLSRLHGTHHREPGAVTAALADAGAAPAAEATGSAFRVWRRVMGRLAVAGLPVPHRDLALIGMSADRFLAEKLIDAAVGLALPPLAVGLWTIITAAPPSWPVPAAASLVLAAVLFFVPDLNVRQAAERHRTDFRHAVGAYLDFVRLALEGGAGPNQALEQAPRLSGGWAFTRIAEAIDRARHARIPPWEALARLGHQIGVHELRDLADLADLAGSEGAKIADSISAYTLQMRTRRLTQLREQAGGRTTTMTIPIASLGLAFTVLVAFPQLYLLATG